ncbi:quinol oxidase [Burkholderia mayonis]|uniref:Quinol oxidase n=1 Tax=Burkholderia mayonis TaxID=1385591 RepID=A0A1B4G7Q6_9BURK|nr:DoxX family protein [Burkholderia mayonis]AOJ11948.1 quinol oxidase [Burkholderia mayonis]KVE57210.1 quinol oxidase [Burkholderia mayonis]
MDRGVDSAVLLAARIFLSVLFLSGGVKKLFAYGAFVGYLSAKGIPFPAAMAAPAIATELLGGAMLVLGVRMRVLAPCLALYTLFTAFTGHPFWTFDDPKLRADMTIQFWKNVAIVGGFLALFVSGAGRYSLSSRRTRTAA